MKNHRSGSFRGSNEIICDSDVERRQYKLRNNHHRLFEVKTTFTELSIKQEKTLMGNFCTLNPRCWRLVVGGMTKILFCN